ncbi:MAG: hypothetical protein IJ192_11100 [Clostridia bacterium]|nr:hypothetical protein [Clostridia bacterium]
MESFWSKNMTKEEKILRNKLISVMRESELPCSASWRVLSELSDELGNAVKHSAEFFTTNEIWTRYEAKLAERTE